MSLRLASSSALRFRLLRGISVMMNDHKRSYVITPSKTCENQQGPLVFVFGWGGSKDAHIAKYSKIYEENDLTTIRYVTPIRWLEDGVPGPDLSRPLLPAFEELKAVEREIIFHLFSMNGCIMFSSLWQVLNEAPNGHKIKSQLKGMIFDSCPSYVEPWASAQAIVKIKAPEELPVVQMLRSTLIFGALSMKRASTYTQSFWEPKAYERAYLYYKMLSYTDLSKYQLYLYSKADSLCGYETIEQFHEEQKRRGNYVDYIRFEESAHVEHGRIYREQYQNALMTFCHKTLTNFNKANIANKPKQNISKL